MCLVLKLVLNLLGISKNKHLVGSTEIDIPLYQKNEVIVQFQSENQYKAVNKTTAFLLEFVLS